MSTPGEYTVGYICVGIATFNSCVLSLNEQYEHHLSLPDDDSAYTYGKLGSHNIVMIYRNNESGKDQSGVASKMMRSFPSIKLLILLYKNDDLFPRDVDEVRVDGVVIAQKSVQKNVNLHELVIPWPMSTLPEYEGSVAGQLTLNSTRAVYSGHGQTALLPQEWVVDEVSVFGVPDYGDKDEWEPNSADVAATCARAFVMRLQ